MINKVPALMLICFLCPFLTFTQDYQPTPENLENRKWFQDAKFGMFIHWGIYSVPGVHEWFMETRSIDIKTYEKLATFFHPNEFDATSWVLLAKSAGMKYITITAKHHDGFAMFDSKWTDWDIIDQTEYQKDIIREMAEACREHNIRLFLYYSQLDWHHPDYYPRGQTGQKTGRPDHGNWKNYLTYMNRQLTELLTQYGDIAGIWFDGWWDKKDADWKLEKTYQMIHRLQPQTMVGSNHHQAPNAGEDFQMFEKDLPGQNKSGFNGEASIGQLPLETAETMNNSWGFSLLDKNYKTSRELIQYLVKAAGYNSNFLLNVGPMPNGKIQQEFVDTLQVIGQWMKRNGETIYGTRGGPIPPQKWGVSTQKDNKVFLHILDWQYNSILVPPPPGEISEVLDYTAGKKLPFEVSEYGLLINLQSESLNKVDHIVELVLK